MCCSLFFGFHNAANSGGITTDQTRVYKVINSNKKLANALKRISKENVASVLLDAETFAVSQLLEHRNTSPLATIATALGNIAGKPYGLSPKQYVEHYEAIGLVWDKKKSAFSIGKDADFTDVPVGYWVGMERPVNNESDSDKATKAFARIAKSELSLTQAMALLKNAYKADLKVAA